MLADIIILAIVGILFVLCIRKQIKDYKNGIPSCGLSSGCGGCSGCAGCEAAGSCQTMKTSKRMRAKGHHKEEIS